MEQKKVVIYSLPTCPHCKMAKKYLSQKGVDYVDHNVAKDEKKLKEMVKKSGQRGVPVIMVDDELLIGFNQAKLDKLLAA